MIAATATSVLATEIDTSALGPALVAGLVAGLAAAAVTLAFIPRRKRVGVIGLPIAVAALFRLRHDIGPPWAPVLLWAAVGVAFVAGEFVERSESPLRWYGLPIAGVMMAATNIPTVPILARVAAAAAAVVTGLAIADLDRRHSSQGLGVLLLVVTCWAPVFLTPGGRAGPALAGAATFMVLLAVPKPFARVGAGGAAAVAFVYWWIVLSTAGWPQGGDNLVGAGICCGFLLLEPLARFVLHRLSGLQNRLRSTRDSVPLVIATAVLAQIALGVYGVAVTARTEMLDLALLSALPVLVVGAVVAVEVVPSPRRQSHHDSHV